jgi:hypothetical protein
LFVKRAIYDIDESLLIYYIESAANFKEKYNDSGFTTEVIAFQVLIVFVLLFVDNKWRRLFKNSNNLR